MITGIKHYISFSCNMGWLGILSSDQGILRLTLPKPTVKESLRHLGKEIEHAYWTSSIFQGLIERLRAYFNGHQVYFPDKLNTYQATPFHRKVWEVTRLIPYGDTRTYRWVAEQIGKPKATQAVGQALSRNPLPIIIPCHRVVTKYGKLGGFSEGLAMKRALLSLES